MHKGDRVAKVVDKELMRENIIKAAVATFLKNGVNSTTMEHIAKEADIAKGTLYLYFSSKQDLVSACNVDHYTSLKASLIPKKMLPSLDDFLKHIEKNLFINKKRAEYVKIFFEAFGAQLNSKDFTDEYNLFFEEIAAFYEQNLKFLIEKGEADADIDTFTLSRAMVSMMDGLTLHRGFFNIENTKYNGMVRDAIAMFRMMLACKI